MTVGVGLLADVIVTMVLFNEGGIVSYNTSREHWRVVIIGVFGLDGLLTVTTVGGHRG